MLRSSAAVKTAQHRQFIFSYIISQLNDSDAIKKLFSLRAAHNRRTHDVFNLNLAELPPQQQSHTFLQIFARAHTKHSATFIRDARQNHSVKLRPVAMCVHREVSSSFCSWFRNLLWSELYRREKKLHHSHNFAVANASDWHLKTLDGRRE